MKVIDSIEEFRAARRGLVGTVGFVPTMGFLHEGHLALMRRARSEADHLAVSIFVNPTQFAPGGDLDAYPRDPEGDREKCERAGCELLFMPTPESMYAPDHSTFVDVEDLDQAMCGPRRPGHFRGMATVVSKFFNIVEPDVAVFGEKDFQQLAIIRRFVRDLNFSINIVDVPTVREPDGLALSSRNKYLDETQRLAARSLSTALARAWAAYRDGERDGATLVELAKSVLFEAVEPGAIDYVECVHPVRLERYEAGNSRILDQDGAVLAMAVQVGKARLIDNLRLDRPLPKELRPSSPA
jgi:pantoate--beta-alanine ligase